MKKIFLFYSYIVMSASYLIFAGLGITGITALFLGEKKKSPTPSSGLKLSSYRSPAPSLSSYTSQPFLPSYTQQPSLPSYTQQPSLPSYTQQPSYMQSRSSSSSSSYEPSFQPPKYGGKHKKKSSKYSTKRKKY